MTESKPYKQRFKGVEHFLRRVAFNLGNTPSQTEVKIISCIPIDVTDLQAKIQFLERQLQDTNRYHSKSKKSKTSAQVVPLEPFQSSTTESGIIVDKSGAFALQYGEAYGKGGAAGDKRASVAERTAAGDRSGVVGDRSGVVGDKVGGVGEKNGALGNKDCVAGAVGAESSAVGGKNASVGAKNGVGGAENGALGGKNGAAKSAIGVASGAVGDKNSAAGVANSVVGVANNVVGAANSAVGAAKSAIGSANNVVGNKSGTVSATDGVVGDKSGTGEKKDATDAKSNKSNTGGTVVNTILYGSSYNNQIKTAGYCSDKSLRSDKSRYKPSYSGCGASRRRKSNVSFALPTVTTAGKEDPSCSTSSHENIDSDNGIRNIAEAERKLAAAEHYYSNLFRKPKKKKKIYRGKNKLKTQLVYFAQHTENNPFFSGNGLMDPFQKLNNKNMSISHAYLNNVIRKQYDPQFVVQEFSDTSHFSRPVCRDISEQFARSPLYESDVCSCCHGRFQNIDNYMPKDFDFINKITQCKHNYTNKTYYDSNLYDIVPVKENTNKFLKEDICPNRDIEIKCWPEQFRSKYRHDPKTAKYPAESSLKKRDNLNVQSLKPKGKSEQYNMGHKRINKQVNEASKLSSKRCNIDYSDINRNIFNSAKVKNSDLVKTIVLKNELIETDNLISNLPLKNQSTQLELIPDDNKTESTLNQIKSILQSVLAEVKTNSKVNGSMEATPKRDAVVQKGTSQNNMQGQSTLLHSFTYNHSYNANPHLPSCSRQLSAGHYCIAGVPYQPSSKYLQNFPVFVHPSSGRRLCACYYKNSSHKSSKYKQASVAATNTDKEFAGETEKSSGNKETEKLIQEIYKSMAATVNFPTKENSLSESIQMSDDVKSTKNNFLNEYNNKLTDVRSVGTVVDKHDIEIEVLNSSNVSSDTDLVDHVTKTQPKDMIKPQTISGRCHNHSASNEPNLSKLYRLEHSTETIFEDDEESEAPSDVTEDKDIVDSKEFESPPKHGRKGLLQRMFNSVKMFKKRKVNQKIQNEIEASEASDSDDYETIYSGRTAVLRPKYGRQTYKHNLPSKRKPANENVFIRSLHEKDRRSPYLEQEYRRQWNERLMFDKRERQYSSERPLSKQSPLRDDRPVYLNNYEARSVLVDKKLSPLKYVSSKAQVTEKLKRDSLVDLRDGAGKDKFGWLKKHKLVNCGEQWKNFILEN